MRLWWMVVGEGGKGAVAFGAEGGTEDTQRIRKEDAASDKKTR